MKKNRASWEIALVIVTALWGWSFVAIHDALLHLSDSAFNSYRFLIAAVVLIIIIFVKQKKIRRHDWVSGFITGIALYLAFLFQTKGLVYTTASNASFITGLAVVFTPIFAYLILKMLPEKRQIVGALIATIGLAFLTLNDLTIHLGDVLVLLCAVSFALHIVLLSKVSKESDPLNITFVQLFVVGVLSLMQSFAFNEFSIPTGKTTIQSIFIIAILGTAIGFFVQTKAQVASSPNRIALIIVLEPLFGGLFGYFLANDRLTFLNWLGAALILAGMLITELKLTRKRSDSTPLNN